MRGTLLAILLMGISVPVALRSQGLPASADPLVWVRIPQGRFLMGCVPADTLCGTDERPRHTVTISRDFEMTATEITVGQFRATMPDVDPQPAWSTSPQHPIVSVVWDEAVAVCRAVGARLP
ncbi:MAG: SUMF1/EgtB/PvdO family nonheme iron enzyme, partial [Vicinamibacterales bacterium]